MSIELGHNRPVNPKHARGTPLGVEKTFDLPIDHGSPFARIFWNFQRSQVLTSWSTNAVRSSMVFQGHFSTSENNIVGVRVQPPPIHDVWSRVDEGAADSAFWHECSSLINGFPGLIFDTRNLRVSGRRCAVPAKARRLEVSRC